MKKGHRASHSGGNSRFFRQWLNQLFAEKVHESHPEIFAMSNTESKLLMETLRNLSANAVSSINCDQGRRYAQTLGRKRKESGKNLHMK